MHFDSCDVTPYQKQFHGKAIGLDVSDARAPLPVLFLIHEQMVRAKNFYQPTPDVEVTNDWQEWLVNEGVVYRHHDGTFHFHCSAPSSDPPPLNVQMPTTQVTTSKYSLLFFYFFFTLNIY